MLTFEQKLNILESIPDLERRNVSLGRVNFHFEGSAYDKKTVVYHLHPNGNGFVYAGLLQHPDADDKGFVNIRDFEEKELLDLVKASMASLSKREDKPEDFEVAPTAAQATSYAAPSGTGGLWINDKGETLTLKYEDDLWYIYSGQSLEMAFETREEAGEYLNEEGFTPHRG
ncbi:hypothetical protein [Paenibacillus sanguinis]|uniref:hypothetical protein n=1 Tax=Paenibacillus sanguinis TaxID=225906 RepID=UPI00037B50F5|nr:hypothetical protein [Paenibacillus sanguinis]